jgi:hypothetical protein
MCYKRGKGKFRNFTSPNHRTAGQSRASPDPVAKRATSIRNPSGGAAVRRSVVWRWVGVPGDRGGRRRGRARVRPVEGRRRRAPHLVAHRGLVLRGRGRPGRVKAGQRRTSDAGSVCGGAWRWRPATRTRSAMQSWRWARTAPSGLHAYKESPLSLRWAGLHTCSQYRRRSAHSPARANLLDQNKDPTVFEPNTILFSDHFQKGQIFFGIIWEMILVGRNQK